MKVPLRTASGARRIVCPFCESGTLVVFGPGPLLLVRAAARRLHAGDVAGNSRPARRPGLPPLRVRPPGDARAARWSVPLSGVPLGGASDPGTAIWIGPVRGGRPSRFMPDGDLGVGRQEAKGA
jgi:hypothetical protein